METKTGLNWQNCLKWLKRFKEHGFNGLGDVPRKGKPAVITPEGRAQVMALGGAKPDDAGNLWTSQGLRLSREVP